MKKSLEPIINSHFLHKPTKKQALAIKLLTAFLEDNSTFIFILKGFAGTGKTTLISSVVASLEEVQKKAVLLAPTGRASKVISKYANREASTIHKKIYYPQVDKSGSVTFLLQKNKHTDATFIVDEASMISDNTSNVKIFETGSVLRDLIEYAQSGKNCKLIFVGDTAQLPPVNTTVSGALDVDWLQQYSTLQIAHAELDEVMRQHVDSGILSNATQLREHISCARNDFKFDLKSYPDMVRLFDSYEVHDGIASSYSKYSKDETTIIVRSNKRAVQYNQLIRSKILGYENDIAKGDYLMVVKNNYFWLNPDSEAGFIANGDVLEIQKIKSLTNLYGTEFAEVTVKMIDYPNQASFDTVLILKTLCSESPSLSYEDNTALYKEVLKDYSSEKASYKKHLKVKQNKYFNALQVKYAYAVTCHKSQGGQWDSVFVEQPYLPDGQNTDYLRWLYTASTRAKKKLHLIGFKDDMFV